MALALDDRIKREQRRATYSGIGEAYGMRGGNGSSFILLTT
jgi:hypothetical protein